MFIAVAFASMADKCSCLIGIRAIHGARCCAEPTGTYLRRATAVNTEFMSVAVAMGRKYWLSLTSNNLIGELMGQR